MATHSSILAWRIPWAEEPAGLQSMESQRVRYDRSDLACAHDMYFLCACYASLESFKEHQLLCLIVLSWTQAGKGMASDFSKCECPRSWRRARSPRLSSLRDSFLLLGRRCGEWMSGRQSAMSMASRVKGKDTWRTIESESEAAQSCLTFGDPLIL